MSAKNRTSWRTEDVISVLHLLIERHDLYLVGIICSSLVSVNRKKVSIQQAMARYFWSLESIILTN